MSDGRGRRVVVRIAAMLFGTAAGLLALEGVGRLLPPLPLSASWTIPILLIREVQLERHPDLLWHWPGQGGPEYDPEASLKILSLADSVTVMFDGKGYPEMVEERLDARIAGGVSVWNAGVPGYTTQQALRYLALYADAPAPDLATVQFAWNDHSPNIDGRPDEQIRLPSERVLGWHADLEHFGLYQLLRRAMGRGIAKQGEAMRVPPESYEENLRTIVRLLEERGTEVLLLTSPYLDSSEDYVPMHTDLNRRVARVARDEDLMLVDPVDALVDQPEFWLRPELDPVHFNEVGSEVVADLIVETLEAKGWAGLAPLADGPSSRLSSRVSNQRRPR